MKFSIVGDGEHPLRDRMAAAIAETCRRHGHEQTTPEDQIQFVLNLTRAEAPQFFRRRAQSIFVFSLLVADQPTKDLRAMCYTALVHTLSNILLCVAPVDPARPVDAEGNQEIYLTTPEGGFYHYRFDPETVYRSIIPIAGAHFAIGNRLATDLPRRLWKKSAVVRQLAAYGRELDRLGVLPAPFPLQEVLSPESIQHLYSLFEMKGLSFGNLSAREKVPELGDTTFWMTARGVNKGRLSRIGWDVLLITGFDYELGQALVSVPPDHDARARVSVDAVEHELIYRSFPQVGAIVHVHAWMDGVLCSRQNYPCGTRELAQEALKLLQQAACPSRTAVGLKNHGLTITGPDLEDIFSRIRGKLQPTVPMFA